MCGIAGKIYFNASSMASREELVRMSSSMIHRGPDSSGIYLDKGVGLAFRRLSIIDLSDAGNQPMCNEDEMVWIVFNGECYNYRELKQDLIARGHFFKSDTDTEAFIHAYEEYGMDFLHRVNGMFSLAIYDKRIGKIFLAVDRLGVKPLYFFASTNAFLFGSEIKAIIADPSVPKDLDSLAVKQYFNLGYIMAPRTIFSGLCKMEPGHLISLDISSGTVSAQKKYWQLGFSQCGCSFDDWQEEFEKTFYEAVDRRLISDVPLGVFLSGGLDSTAVLMAMDKLGHKNVSTFSIAFKEDAFDESCFSRSVSERFKSRHHEFLVKPDAIELLPKLAWHFDEPFDDASALPSFYLAQETKKSVTVALSGDGGDELLAGYPRYATFAKLERFRSLLPFGLSNKMAGIIATMLPRHLKTSKRLYLSSLELAQSYQEHMSAFSVRETERILNNDFFKQTSPGFDFSSILESVENDVVTGLQYLDSKTYLPGDILVKVDRTSMANSLEVRSPFLDYLLWEKVFSLPAKSRYDGKSAKLPLKKLLAPIMGQSFVDRKKMGFNVPLNNWFSGQLRSYANDLLLSERTSGRGYVNMDYIREILKQHQTGKCDHSRKIWNLLFFEQWCRVWLD
ncbi:asparagine synthase (glutamine-hydrolyzing) [Candidatus Falkowbacteria bacterium]|nr:asparagine synthase (glutamine-hydrolyzing) [Candidatus Falkowbacteria bacterium]